MFKKLYRRIKYFFIRLAKLPVSSNEIGKSLGFGMFLGLTPTMGFQMIIAAFLANLLNLNAIVMVSAVWITNPWTFIPIYYTNYYIGAVLLNKKIINYKVIKDFILKKGHMFEYFHLGSDIILPLWVGSLIVGSIIGFITYFIIIFVLKKIKRGKAGKINEKV